MLNNPKYWLHILNRCERICSLAGAITVAWLYAWSELGPNPRLAIAFIIIIFMIAGVLTVTSELWKTLLREQISLRESDAEWKAIREQRWPDV